MTSYNCECVDADTFQPRQTLAQLRRRFLIQTGFAAQADNPPASMTTLADELLLTAQNDLYMKYPALRTRRFFRWTMEEGERFYGLGRNDDGESTATITVTIAMPAVVSWAAHGLAAGDQVWFTTTGALPTGITASQRYFVLATGLAAGAFQFSTAAGGAAVTTSGSQSGVHTGHGIAASCLFPLNPYKAIEWVGVKDLGGAWLPMAAGIPPEFYTMIEQPGIPSRYEIRSCIEVLPAPYADGLELWIKGHFGLASFTEDSDQTTIDSESVLLWAVAMRKAATGASDANNIASIAKARIGDLTAGTHGTKKYVPGTRPIAPAAMPIFLPLNGAPP